MYIGTFATRGAFGNYWLRDVKETSKWQKDKKWRQDETWPTTSTRKKRSNSQPWKSNICQHKATKRERHSQREGNYTQTMKVQKPANMEHILYIIVGRCRYPKEPFCIVLQWYPKEWFCHDHVCVCFLCWFACGKNNPLQKVRKSSAWMNGLSPSGCKMFWVSRPKKE